MQWNNSILYEQAANEHMRVCLKLERLFRKLQQYFRGETAWHSRITVETILDIVNVINRPDLKGMFTKELLRHQNYLKILGNSPDIDQNKLSSVLNKISEILSLFEHDSGKIGNALRENEFLTIIRLQMSNPGGACDANTPAYHYWLQQPFKLRQEHLMGWFRELEIIKSAVSLMLRLVRENGLPEYQTANRGFYQTALEPKNPCQLIRIETTQNDCVYPEISIGLHRISIRFLTPSYSERPQQSENDIPFNLTCCT